MKIYNSTIPKILSIGLLILSVVCLLMSCGWGSQENFSTPINNNLSLDLQLNWDGQSQTYDKKISLSKENTSVEVEGKSPVRELQVYLDQYPVDSINTDMVFIYDLYLGWSILKYEDLSVWKDFSELPKDKELLVKLRLLENPDVDFDGEKFK